MTIFQLIKNDFSIVGIELHKSIQNHSRLSAKKLIFSFLSACNVPSVVLHIFYDDNTFREYIDSAYTCSGMSLTGMVFGYFIWKTQNIFEFINDFEKSVQQSEYGLLLSYKFAVILSLFALSSATICAFDYRSGRVQNFRDEQAMIDENNRGGRKYI